MKIKVIGASMRTKTNEETIFTDISDFVSDVRVSGSKSECCRSLDFKLLRGDFEKTLPEIDLNLGDAVKMMEINEKTGEVTEFFSGVVWTKNIKDNEIAIDVTCYDKSIYLNKNEPETQIFNQMTPDAVAKKIIEELGLEPGELAPGSVDDFNLRSKSGYDAIMEAYDKESEKSGKSFKLVYKDGKVNVFENKEKVSVVLEELNEPVEGKLLNTSYTESLDDVVNEVKALEDEEKDKKEEKKSKESSKARYGTLQKIVKGQPADIEGVLKDAKKDADVECIGNRDMVTGKSITLNSSILQGEFYIISDEHTLNDAVHTCKLKLSTEF